MESWVVIACAMAIITTGNAVTVPTVAQNEQVDLTVSATVTLQCLVSYSNSREFLGNAAAWYKIQGEDEPVVISQLLNIQEPFAATSRFEVVNAQQDDNIDFTRMEMPLKINNMVSADSGKYRCGTPEVYVEHQVAIIEAVSLLTIRGGPNATNASTWRTVSTQSAAPVDMVFHAVEGSNSGSGFFECMAEGGYPSRVLSVSLPDRDLTSYMTSGSNESYEGDVVGLKSPSTLSWVKSTNFGLHREDHGRTLTCSAAIYENNVPLQPTTLMVNVIVHYRPVIECDASYDMVVNQANIQLTCIVQARPIPSDVSFYLGTTHETIYANGVTHPSANAYANMMTQGDNTVAVSITFIKVQLMHYQEYRLTASNSVGRAEQTFTITEGTVIVDNSLNDARTVVSSSLLVIIALILQFW